MIYIDLREIVSKSELTQAIKIFKNAYPELDMTLIINKDEVYTFDDSFKIIHDEKEVNDINLLIKVKENDRYSLDKDLMSVKFLKSDGNKILITDFATSNIFSLSEKLDILKSKVKLNDDFKYALMNTKLSEDNEILKFDEEHKDDPNYKGLMLPEDVYKNDLNVVLGTPLVTNIFLSSILSTISLININKEKEENKKGIFEKMFSFNKGTYIKENENSFVENFNLYINKEKLYFEIESTARVSSN